MAGLSVKATMHIRVSKKTVRRLSEVKRNMGFLGIRDISQDGIINRLIDAYFTRVGTEGKGEHDGQRRKT